MDIISLSATYLDSSIQSDNENLEIPGCNLVHSDHPSTLRVINICLLQECVTFKVMIGNKQCSIVCLYRSPCQN